MSIWNGFDEADVEIHGDELDAEHRAFLADAADELHDVCEDCRDRIKRGDDVTEDCGACDEVRCGFAGVVGPGWITVQGDMDVDSGVWDVPFVGVGVVGFIPAAR